MFSSNSCQSSISNANTQGIVGHNDQLLHKDLFTLATIEVKWHQGQRVGLTVMYLIMKEKMSSQVAHIKTLSLYIKTWT